MNKQHRPLRPLKRAVIREELVQLTGSPLRALILDQFLTWTRQLYGFDLEMIDAKLSTIRRLGRCPDDGFPDHPHWITKTLSDLGDALMITMDATHVNLALDNLIGRGWIERNGADHFRCNLARIQSDLAQKGYALHAFPMLSSVQDDTAVSAAPNHADRGGLKPPPRGRNCLPDGSYLNLHDPSGLFLKDDGAAEPYQIENHF